MSESKLGGCIGGCEESSKVLVNANVFRSVETVQRLEE